MEDLPIEITGAMVREAAERIRPLAKRTPVMTSTGFDARASVRAFFKCENLQKGGAFKIRGAANLILSLSQDQLARGVVAFSSGNHAQAVAIVAQSVGARATIVMPLDAPRAKLEATRSYGATVVTYDRARENREAIARRLLDETGATLVPPFDHPMIIAGQGTAALELLEEVPALDAIIAPVSGGGLLAGCAIAARSVSPQIRMFGAEPEGANDTFLSLLAGTRVEVEPNTIADGLRVAKPGVITFPILQRYLERMLLVSDGELRATVKYLLMRMKLLVEPSGAAGAAAVLAGKLPGEVKRIGIILSGGNIDFDDLVRY